MSTYLFCTLYVTETILGDLCILFLQPEGQSSWKYKGPNSGGPRYAKTGLPACQLNPTAPWKEIKWFTGWRWDVILSLIQAPRSLDE